MDNIKQEPVYREADVQRFIAKFGQKPPEEVRKMIREDLAWQKEKFLALERIRHRQDQRARGNHR